MRPLDRVVQSPLFAPLRQPDGHVVIIADAVVLGGKPPAALLAPVPLLLKADAEGLSAPRRVVDPD